MAGVLVAFQLSYAIPVALHLFYARRKLDLPRGPWSMGRWGWAFDIVSLCFGTFMIVFSKYAAIPG